LCIDRHFHWIVAIQDSPQVIAVHDPAENGENPIRNSTATVLAIPLVT
jgi:hypothetical protein